ncbi:hypothetical protein [Pectinatus frisingensis]|uniref:hypothetical protein n=1 Tax=Pectinatus frisingensis TaxID=865 RepID=UPI0018C4C76B|nr:hypothetical protein [Pectinatus frisingensis]
MAKNIKLSMEADRDIKICVNGKIKYTVNHDNRSISAKDIYNILDYSVGDKYTISIENINDIDAAALEFFKDLFDEITKEINELEIMDRTAE